MLERHFFIDNQLVRVRYVSDLKEKGYRSAATSNCEETLITTSRCGTEGLCKVCPGWFQA